MNRDLFSEISGTEILVCDFSIEYSESTLAVKMSCIAEDQNTYLIVFENVSKLNLSEIFYPFRVCGFEIIDCNSREYQKDTRFYVNDYEDGKMSFYCERFEIFHVSR